MLPKRFRRFLVIVLILYSLVYSAPWGRADLTTGDKSTPLQRGHALDAVLHPKPQPATARLSLQYVSHPPIKITNNSDFAAFGFPGAGMEENPYLIEGLKISTSNEKLIHIQNTTAYFHIRNNLFDGLTGYNDGISLRNVTHGTIETNIITNCDEGIILINTRNTTITNNTVNNNDVHGILLLGPKYITLSDNTISNCISGIFLRSSDHSTISHNTIFNCSVGGIHIDMSGYSNISHNFISNCGFDGIYLDSSEHITISHNTISQNNKGIQLFHTWNNIVTHNTVSNCDTGIELSYGRWHGPSENNTVAHNTVSNCGGGIYFDVGQNIVVNNTIINTGFGIHGQDFLQARVENNTVNGKFLVFWQNVDGGTIPLGAGQIILINSKGVEITGQNISRTTVGVYAVSSSNLNIYHNNLSNCSGGISLDSSGHSTVTNNTITNCNNGIQLDGGSKNNTITHNTIFNNSNAGIALWECEQNTVAHNIIANNTDGLEGYGYCNNNTIVHNAFIKNMAHGICFSEMIIGDRWSYKLISPNHNKVQENDFLDIIPMDSSQASDDGENNIFAHNYWDDHDNMDLNADGITDDPYTIAGDATNQDLTPLATFANPHRLLAPTLIYPNGGETIQGIVTLYWAPVFDAWGHSVTYAISYSTDDGRTWIPLVAGLTLTSYEWDTTALVDGPAYRIKVVATCSDGLMAEDRSDVAFTVQNRPASDFVPEFTVLKSLLTLGGLGLLFAARKRRLG